MPLRLTAAFLLLTCRSVGTAATLIQSARLETEFAQDDVARALEEVDAEKLRTALERAKDGDPGALEQVAPRLRGWAWHYLRQRFQAQLAEVQVGAGRELRFQTVPGGVKNLYFARSTGDCFALVTDQQAVAWWNVTGNRKIREFLSSGTVHDARIGRNGERVLLMTDTGYEVWPLSGGRDKLRPKLTLTRSRQWLGDPVFDASFRRFAVLAEDGIFLSHDQAGAARPRPLLPPTFAAAMSRSGKRIATVDGNDIKVWNVSDGRPLQKLENHGAVSMLFSPDGSVLAFEDPGEQPSPRSLVLWHCNEPERATTAIPLRGGGATFQAIAGWTFSRDGSQLAFARTNGKVAAWDVEAGRQLREHRLEAPARTGGTVCRRSRSAAAAGNSQCQPGVRSRYSMSLREQSLSGWTPLAGASSARGVCPNAGSRLTVGSDWCPGGRLGRPQWPETSWRPCAARSGWT